MILLKHNPVPVSDCVKLLRLLEISPSGLWRTLGKRVGCKPSGVRIPLSPQITPENIEFPGFFVENTKV